MNLRRFSRLIMGVKLVTLAATLVGGSWDSHRPWQTDPDHRPGGNAA